jgi:hypothetical protein
MWINQPSTLQQCHHLHGTNVLAVHEYDDTWYVCFLSGPVHGQQINKLALSPGWIKGLDLSQTFEITAVGPRNRARMATTLRAAADDLDNGAEWVSGGLMCSRAGGVITISSDLRIRSPREV